MMNSEVMENIQDYKDSLTDSDDEKSVLLDSQKKGFSGKKTPVHAFLGGGKYADILLWRDMKISSSIFASVTIFWLLFEWIGYHLITLTCHALIVSLAVLFIWSNVASFLGKQAPKLPDAILPEGPFLTMVNCSRVKINQAFSTLHSISSGKDMKRFLMTIAGLWVLSVIGSWLSFLTFFYIAFLIMLCAPLFYEKYGDRVDATVEKAMAGIRKKYEKALQKFSGCLFSDKKNN